MHPVDLLSVEWRTKAADLRRFHAEGAASAFEECADDLEETWRIWQTEPLTLQEAADDCGYSYSRLQQMTAEGSLTNVGDRFRPRVRRIDLPRKARGKPTREAEPDLAAELLAKRLG